MQQSPARSKDETVRKLCARCKRYGQSLFLGFLDCRLIILQSFVGVRVELPLALLAAELDLLALVFEDDWLAHFAKLITTDEASLEGVGNGFLRLRRVAKCGRRKQEREKRQN